MRRITSGSISFNDDYPPDIIANLIKEVWNLH